MENRAQQHHRERLTEALKEEIATIVEGELGDPRIGLVTVTDVRLMPDGKISACLGFGDWIRRGSEREP